MRRSRVVFLLAIVVVLALAGLALWRLRQTPEWKIVSGQREAQLAACRELWQKADWRVRWGLTRLLSNPDPAVRLAAVEALSRHPLPELALMVERLTDDPDAAVVARAYEYLLSPANVGAERWVARLREKLEQSAFRHAQPELLAAYARLTAEPSAPAVAWLIDLLLDDDVLYPALADELRRHPDALRPYRPLLVSRLDGLRDVEVRYRFVLGALTAIDGRLRGYAAADWQEPLLADAAAVAAAPVDRFVVEAEWASELRPNYQIDTYAGERALLLGEGAGGYMSWLGRGESTVDIGSGRFPFRLAQSGTYQLWARLFMENKCGNSLQMTVDGTGLGQFSDATDRFGLWEWTSHGTLYLNAGDHQLEFLAHEDGVHIDKFALLPVSEDPRRGPLPVNSLYDPRALPTISFAMSRQHQVRGTTQPVTVWIRRPSLELAGGRLTFAVAPPFELPEGSHAEIVFAGEEPLARATFLVRLPPDAVGGEVEAVATLAATDGRMLAEGRTVLGVHYDWYSSGPLALDSELARQLSASQRLDRETFLAHFQPFPLAGYDRYRRLDFEAAYGQSQNRIVFLYTEIEVEETGTYQSFLTSDDEGVVAIDGATVATRLGNGPAEGRMAVERVELSAGRHQVLVSVTQADFADPEGDDADRHSYNNWVFKWLLRHDRHRLAPGIRGGPVQLGEAAVTAPVR